MLADAESLKGEARYGMPAADQILVNRHYTVGYNYYYRQAKWALEIIDPDMKDLERADNFRADYRVPEMFRADLADYEGSGYDRGHLVASADQRETQLQNSETFLLSNMSPQDPGFNRNIWKDLEAEVRHLDGFPTVFETYVISGPIFYYDTMIEEIGSEDRNGVTLPIPHAYFKSVLAERHNGALHMWSFLLKNEPSSRPLADFRVPTTTIEKYSGLKLWANLVGSKIESEKRRVRAMW